MTPAPSVMTPVQADHPLHGHDTEVLGPAHDRERWTVVTSHDVWLLRASAFLIPWNVFTIDAHVERQVVFPYDTSNLENGQLAK